MDDDRTGSPNTRGSLPQQKVGDRPGVSVVNPEEYPESDRDASSPDRPTANS